MMTFGKRRRDVVSCSTAAINAPGNWLPMVMVESVREVEVRVLYVVVSSILLVGVGETVG